MEYILILSKIPGKDRFRLYLETWKTPSSYIYTEIAQGTYEAMIGVSKLYPEATFNDWWKNENLLSK